MAGNRNQHYCPECGVRIGVYEPIWHQHPDGTLASTSLLNLDGQYRTGDQPPCLFHLGCLALDEVPQTHTG